MLLPFGRLTRLLVLVIVLFRWEIPAHTVGAILHLLGAFTEHGEVAGINFVSHAFVSFLLEGTSPSHFLYTL